MSSIREIILCLWINYRTEVRSGVAFRHLALGYLLRFDRTLVNLTSIRKINESQFQNPNFWIPSVTWQGGATSNRNRSTKKVSSVYGRLETHDSQSLEFFALDSSSLKARRTSFDNPSAVVLKRKGDGESPWQIPLNTWSSKIGIFREFNIKQIFPGSNNYAEGKPFLSTMFSWTIGLQITVSCFFS